jgi:glucose/arabinose dehydrogenase
MKMKFYILSALLFSGFIALSQPKIKLDTFSRSYAGAVDIANDGSTSRIFVVAQSGIIYVLDSNGVKLDTFMDIRSRVQTANEEGLLGLAFHPDYANNGYFYVFYTKKNQTDNGIYRYKVSANPNRANTDSFTLVLTIPHPTNTNHNGGCLKFGVDGYLYISTGDGGGAGDIPNNAQSKFTLSGKILRIDVNQFDTTYIIPATNPFYSQPTGKKELWALGLRNPWRLSFDRLTHDMWIGDVGQSAWEEVDFQAANSTGGENYGWRCYEGNTAYNTFQCGAFSTYVPPIFVYDHGSSGGIAVTGGFVYRGNKYDDLKGYYVTADYGTGNFWVIKKNGSVYNTTALGKPLAGANISSFGEDIRGELYASNVSNGVIYKVRELCSPFRLNTVSVQHPSCPNVLNGMIEVSSTGSNGAVGYAWSNGVTSGGVVTALGPGTYIVTATDAIGCVRKDTFILNNLDTVRTNVIKLINPSCPGVSNGTIEISGTGGTGTYTYNWSNGETTALNDSLPRGMYMVTVVDGNNCTKIDTFTLYNADTLRIALTSFTNPSCLNVNNGSLLVTGVGGTLNYQYDWSNGAATALNNNLPAGSYMVTVQDANNCTAIDTFTIFNADTLDKPVITQNGTILQTATGFTYKWKLNGNEILGSVQDTIHPSASGNYTVEITDINGCKAASDSYSFVFTGIKHKNSDIEKLSLYPNPASDNLTIDIRFNSMKKSTVKISNNIGQVIYEEKFQGKEILKTISLKQLAKGIYELSVYTDDYKLQASTFVKE